jgi:phage tail sheath protein FI
VPEYLAPGVYVEEASYRSKPIEGVPTGARGLLGSIRRVDAVAKAVAVVLVGVLLGVVASIAADKARRRRRRLPPTP